MPGHIVFEVLGAIIIYTYSRKNMFIDFWIRELEKKVMGMSCSPGIASTVLQSHVIPSDIFHTVSLW